MLNQHNSKQQVSRNIQNLEKLETTSAKTRIEAKIYGDWDSRIAKADPDPEMITDSHYWEAYCEGMYQRYLKKYGINQSN